MENTAENKTVEKTDEKVTLKYVLDKLDEVRKAFLESEEEQISLICSPDDMDPDSLDPEYLPSIFQNYYESITKIKTLSQTSLQQMTAVYDKLINKLTPKTPAMSPEDRSEFMELVNNWGKNAGPGVLIPDFDKLAQVMYGAKTE